MLTKVLAELIASAKLKPTGIESALSFLADIDSGVATECVRALLPPGIAGVSEQVERTKGVLCVGFAKLTSATWDMVWPLMQANDQFAEHVFLKVAYAENVSNGCWYSYCRFRVRRLHIQYRTGFQS